MEHSKCPDCGSVIGGSSHRLDSTNRHAGEIDGSEREAYGQIRDFDWNHWQNME